MLQTLRMYLFIVPGVVLSPLSHSFLSSKYFIHSF